MSGAPLVGLGLVAFLLAAWLPPPRWRAPAMLAVSLTVLGLAALQALGLALALTLLVWALTRAAERRAAPLLAVLALTAGAFCVLKVDAQLGAGLRTTARLGFAYYSLRLLHYAFERYLGRQPALSLPQLLGYALFLPTLWAGPIHRAGPFLRELRRRRWDAALLATGAERILYGLVKVTVLGNVLVLGVLSKALERAALPAWQHALGELVTYGANLYLQFAGYCDVAIGVALLAGIRVEENFDWPFLARSVPDFWRRWHVTLSDWCRDYVFVPVSALTRSPSLGVVASMLVLGLWHEPSLRYLAWGAYHGAGIALWRAAEARWGQRRIARPALRRAATVLCWAATLGFVLLSFALTSQPTLREGVRVWATIFTLEA